MRRYMMIIFLFTFLVGGCQSSERKDSISGETSLFEETADNLFMTEEYLPDYDAQNQFSRYKDAAIVDNIIYFKCGTNMCFYDMNTETASFLCDKPECTHSTGSCNAYFQDLCGFCYYNQKIYWVEKNENHYYLVSMNLDGSDHTRVQELPEPFMFYEYSAAMRIHRGYVYMAEVLNEVEIGQSYNRLVLARVKLGEEKSEPETIIDKKGDAITGYDFYMNFWGNTMYFLERDYITEGNNRGIVSMLYTYDIHTTEAEKISKEFYASETPSDLLVTEDGIFVSMYYYEDSSENRFYDKRVLQFNLESEEWMELAEIPFLETGDPMLLENNLLAASWGWDTPRSLIADYEGNIIRTCNFPLSETQTNVSVYPLIATEEYVIFDLKPIGEGTESIILVPLDPEEELQILCS